MIPLQIVAKLLKILRSGASPGQIAGGFLFGMILGLTPLWNLHNLLVLCLVILLNVNLSMFFVSFALFSGLAYLFDPWFHALGYWLLVDSGLTGLWQKLYQIPLLALSNFNNTVVLGSLVIALVLTLPNYFGVKKMVLLYREKLDVHVEKLKIVQGLKSSKLYSWYERIKNFGE